MADGVPPAESIRYWHDLLTTAPRTPLPARPAAEEAPGPVRLRLPAALTADLRAAARGRAHARHTVLAAAVVALLHRYTASAAVTVGQAPALEGPAGDAPAGSGPILPVTCEVRADDGLMTLRRRLHDALLDAYGHQGVPPGVLRPAAHRQPPFDVGVRTEGLHADADGGAALMLTFREPPHEPGVLEVVARHDPARCGGAAATRFLRHLAALLGRALAEPDRPLAECPLMTDADRELLAGFNATAAPGVPAATVHELFARAASERPGAIALLHSGPPVTYAELAARAGALARAVRARGIRPGDRVAVAAPRTPQMVAAVLAVLMAGAVYVPVDRALPDERVRLLLRDSGAALVLAQRWAGAPAAGGVPVLDLDAAPPAPAGPLPPAGGPRDVAYVIYTSGSTGAPKGVMVEHRSLVELLTWKQGCYPLRPGDVVLHKTSSAFDVSVWELFGWFTGGAALCLLDTGGERDPEAVIEAVERHGVTVAHFVPPLLGPFADYVAATGARGRLRSLRQAFCGGDVLAPDLVDRFRTAFGDPGPALVNLYGPTEATVHVTHFACDGSPGPVPIGRPVANTRLYVVDGRLRPQPAGVPGELCIAGNSLARGYLGRDDLTRERFVADPFPGETRVYRTGDICRWHDDGTLEYLGRADRQVKVHGYRIDTGEVEHHLRACPGVVDAYVLAVGESPERRRLVAYVTGRQVPDAAELAGRLGRVLPAPMVPSAIVRLTEFPLTASGKIDVPRLPPALPGRAIAGNGA